MAERILKYPVLPNQASHPYQESSDYFSLPGLLFMYLWSFPLDVWQEERGGKKKKESQPLRMNTEVFSPHL